MIFVDWYLFKLRETWATIQLLHGLALTSNTSAHLPGHLTPSEIENSIRFQGSI